MDKTSYDFLDVLRGTIEDKVSTLDQTIYCKIVGINEDYTLDVTIVPDEITRIKSVVNASKYEFNVGDYGILYKIGNNLANAFIIAKLGPSYEDNQPLSKQDAGSGDGDSSGGTAIINYYQTSIPTNYVTTDTEQGITGKKWFINNGGPSTIIQSSVIDLETPPTSAAQFNYIDFIDKTGQNRLGVLGSTLSSDGYAGMYLQARNAASMGIKANANGEVYSWAHTPAYNNSSDQIATTEWVRKNNQAIRGFDALNYYTVDDVKIKYPADNYFLIAYSNFCVNWAPVFAEIDMLDWDTRAAAYKVKVTGLLESATNDNVTTYTNKGNIGVTDSFGQRLNSGISDINNELFLVCRTTNKGRVRYEIWYNQRYSYNRHTYHFNVDKAPVRTSECIPWNKLNVPSATDNEYAKKGVTVYMDSKKVNPTYIPTSSWGEDVFKTAVSDDESYTNVTIFNNNLYSITHVGVSTILNTTPYIDAKIKGYSGYKTIPTVQKRAEYRILTEDKGYLGGIRYDRDTDGDSATRMVACSTLSGANNAVMLSASKGTASTKNTDSNIWAFVPLTDGNISLGGSGNRWGNAYIKKDIYISQTSGENSGITWQSTSNNATRAVFRHYDDGTTENFVVQSGGFLFRPLNNSNTKSIKVDPANGVLYPEQSLGADLGSSSRRWNNAYLKRLNLSSSIAVNDTGNVVADATNGISFTGTKATTSMIRFADNGANVYGNGIVIGGGGVAIMGSGESANNLYSTLVKAQISAGKTAAAASTEVAQSEHTYITSDNAVRIFSNCNTIANRKELNFNNSGQLVYTPTAGGTAYTYTLPNATGQMMVGSLSGTTLTITL